MTDTTHAHTARLADALAHDLRNATNVVSLGLHGVEDDTLRADLQKSLAEFRAGMEGIIATARSELGRLSNALALTEVVRQLEASAACVEQHQDGAELVVSAELGAESDLRSVHAILAARGLPTASIDEAEGTVQVRFPSSCSPREF